MVIQLGTDIIHLLTDYHTSIKFFYPILILAILTLIVTVHSRKYKTSDDKETIHTVKLQIENTSFMDELKKIKSGDFSDYLFMINHDMEKMTTQMKEYRVAVKKFNKYDAKYHSYSNGILRKHAGKMRDAYLMSILYDLENMKQMKMAIVNDEVYDEWKKKQKQ